MQQLNDYSDQRNKSWCIHCGVWLSQSEVTKDHAPSKSLLHKPYPDNLPVTQICKDCNNNFSDDEEYLRVFIECVLIGSTDPKKHQNAKIARALQRNSVLSAKIEDSKRTSNSEGLYWQPDLAAVKNIILKNARGHAYYEFGEPLLENPTQIWVAPLAKLTEEERLRFEDIPDTGLLPEVGSRMLQRLFDGPALDNGWINLQVDTYRYAVAQYGKMLVRTVIHNYLATEVWWNDEYGQSL